MNLNKFRAIFGRDARPFPAFNAQEQHTHLNAIICEIICIENTICEQYGVRRDELCKMRPFLSEGTTEINAKHIRTVNKIKVNVELPDYLKKFGPNDKFDMSIVRSPRPLAAAPADFYYQPLLLTEKKLLHDGNSIQFWEWSGYWNDYTMFSSLIFVRRTDLKKYYRAALSIKNSIQTPIIEPILPRRMLQEIYDNSVGFIENYKANAAEYKKFDIPYKRGLLLCGSPGQGKCINVNSWVFTSEGMYRIGDFLSTEQPDEASDCSVKVYGLNGIDETAQIYNGGYRETKTIRSRFGFQLEGTFNHRIITTDGKDKIWKRMDELSVGDYVAIPRNMNLFGTSTDLDYAQVPVHYKNPDVILPTQMTEDLAYWMGLLTGDGGLTVKNSIILTTCDLMSEYTQITKKLFNITPRVKPSRSKAVDCIFSSVQVKNFLQLLGMLPVYACEKTIPRAILSSPSNIIKSYLQGLFDTDGWSEASGYVGFASCSKELCNTVHLLLTNFGIVSRKRFKSNNRSGSWTIEIQGEQAKRFYGLIGFRLERKQAQSSALADKFNTNRDVVPFDGDYVRSLLNDNGPFERRIHREFARYKNEQQHMSTVKAKRLESLTGQTLSLASDDIFWDEVVAIDNSSAFVADFYVPKTNSFSAGGFINHNTMTCKWLKAICEHRKIKYRIVTMQDYMKYASKGRTRELFACNSSEPVVVFFDDLDLIAKSRKISSSPDLLVFLSELDGISPKDGAVYIFTTNQMEELDSAFVRPGRIDLFLTFQYPTSDLRERFIKNRFHPEILQSMDLADAVAKTQKHSFAEIEEIRKLLTLRYISQRKVSFSDAFDTFKLHRKEFQEKNAMGFGRLTDDEPKEPDYYDIEDMLETSHQIGP